MSEYLKYCGIELFFINNDTYSISYEENIFVTFSDLTWEIDVEFLKHALYYFF